jgi:hypothetical protein
MLIEANKRAIDAGYSFAESTEAFWYLDSDPARKIA